MEVEYSDNATGKDIIRNFLNINLKEGEMLADHAKGSNTVPVVLKISEKHNSSCHV